MKKTWKRWLGTVAAALLTSTALAQSPNGAGVATTRGQSPEYSEEGSVRLGRSSASATGRGIRQSQYESALNPDAVFEGPPPGYQGGAAGGPYPEQAGREYTEYPQGSYFADNGIGTKFLRPLNDIQWRVGHQSMEAYGFQGTTTNLNAFIPVMTDGSQNLLFVVPRVNLHSDGPGGPGSGNLGVGLRHFDAAHNRVYGLSGWWDYDSGHTTDYNQVGVSLESLGRYSSTRFNANVPLKNSEDILSNTSFGTPFFQNNNIAYLFGFQRETSYQNYQLELASPVPLLGRYGAEWAVSGYGLIANSNGASDAMGVSGRFEVQVSEDFWINTVVSHDKIYGTNTSINFELTFPNGMQSRWLRPNRGHEKMLASVKRQYRVSTDINPIQESRFFLNPKNGAPIQVAHVDPEAPSVGIGSVGSPFGSVADYMAFAGRSAFDIIYVGRNADGSDTDLNTGIEVLDCQRLLGTGSLADGSVHRFQTLNRGDGVTVFNLPGFANGNAQALGPNPFLTNSAAGVGTPVVSINGNITEVTGFTIDASGTANGIESAVPVDGFVVTNNAFQNALDAINIVSDTSPVIGAITTLPPSRSPGENFGIVTNNVINGALGTPGGMVNGIVIDHVGGTGAEALHLRVTDNTLSTLTGTGIDVTARAGTQIVADATSFGFQNNTIDGAGQGILARSTGAGTIFDLTVQSNTITNSTDLVDPLNPELGAGMGFLAELGGAFNFNLVTDNTVSNVAGGGGRGGAFVAESGGTMTFTPDVVGDPVFFANTFTGNGDDGLLFEATGAGSAITLQEVLNNTFDNNGASGLDFMALAGGAVTSGPITGNALTNNTEDGLSGTADGAGSVLDLQIGSADPLLGLNTITVNDENGIDLLSSNGATLTAPIIRNTITNNTLDGILYTLDNTTHDIVDIQQNTITDNRDGGIDIVADTATINDIFIDANTIDRNLAGDGIRFLAVDSSVANQLLISNNSVIANALNGINIETDNTSINDLVIIDNNQGTAFAAGTLDVDYFNAIFTTWITNNSSAGLDIANVVLNIAPTGQIWRPDITPFNNQFEITGGSDVPVGLQAVNGVAVTAGTVPFPLPNGGVPLNSSTLTFDFNDFNPGEQLDYTLSHSIPAGGMLSGTTLAGSTFTVTLEDGRSATGVLGGTGFTTLTQVFAQTFAGISSNGLDGIRIAPSNGSSITSMTIDNNSIQANRTNGIELLPVDSTLPTIGNAGVISNNTIIGNLTGDGVRMVLPDTNGVPIAIDFTANTITGHVAGLGINVEIDDTSGSFISTLTENTISNNALGGARFAASQNTTMDLTVGDADPLLGNTFTGNGDFNLAIDLVNNASLPGTTLIQNNSFTNAVNGPNVDFFGEGISIRTTDNAFITDLQVLDNTITGNAGDGLRVLANAASQIGTLATPGMLVTGNTISSNLSDGIQIQREGDAIVNAIIGTTGGIGVDPLLGNTINGNTFHGINISTGGGANPAGVSTDITIGQNTINGNGLEANVGNGINVVTNDDSQTRVNAISNVITGLESQDNGIAVLTNNGSYFGILGGANSVFDGNIITDHSANGILLTTTALSQLHVDIVGDTQQAVISGNEADGVRIVDTSGTALGGGIIDVSIGNPASTGPAVGADISPDAPDVVIGQNGNDAIRVAQTGSADLTLDVNNTLASGNRVLGGVSRHGLSYNSDAQATSGTAIINVDNSTFVDFGDDGMNIFFNHNAPGGNLFALNVTDSIIGQTQFSTNVNDGVDIEVRDGGAAFNFDNNLIQNNGGDGFRMVLLAEQMNTSRFGIFPDRDANASGQNETTDPDNPGLPFGGRLWADPNFLDFSTDLILTNNQIRFNGLDGVDLAIGGGTSLGTVGNRAIVRGNEMTGNALFGFQTRTITNALVAPPADSVNNGENTADVIRLDPMAFLFLAFGDNVDPNTTSQLNPTVTGGFYTAGDALKAANRAILTQFNVNTNDGNITTLSGAPVSTLGTFNAGWSTITNTTNTNGNIFFDSINTQPDVFIVP